MADMREKSPPVRPKGAPPVKNHICIHTAPGGVLEFTLGGSDAVLGNVEINSHGIIGEVMHCLLYTSPSPRDGLLSRMPSSA